MCVFPNACPPSLPPSGHTHGDILATTESYKGGKASCVCFSTSFQCFNSLSVISEFTGPVLQEQICVYTLLRAGMTFNKNNNRRCLDLLAAMETGISQRLLLCWWCPQKKQRGPTGSCLRDRPGSFLHWRPPLQRRVSCERTNQEAVECYSEPKACVKSTVSLFTRLQTGCLGEKCLFVVQTLIKIRISSSVFINMLGMPFYSLFISLCNFDYSVYVYSKHPPSCAAWQWGGWCGNCCMPHRGCCCCCYCTDGAACCCCCFEGALIPPRPSSVVVFVWFTFRWNGSRAKFGLLCWPLRIINKPYCE